MTILKMYLTFILIKQILKIILKNNIKIYMKTQYQE